MRQPFSKSTGMVRQLNRIKDHSWKAAIVGGAIRDTIHKVPIDNIDVLLEFKPEMKDRFKPFDSDTWLHYWSEIFNFKKGDEQRYLGGPGKFAVVCSHILSIWQIKKNNERWQLIMINKDIDRYVEENFDFGITRVYCDGEKIRMTDKYLKDIMDKTITLYREHLTENQIKFAIEHNIDNIQRKYPDFRPVI